MVRPVEGFWELHLNSWQADAELSHCGSYRWLLHRPILVNQDTTKQQHVLVFVGLNPSRADGNRDDPTLRRLQGFSHQWGYHHLVVLNLFARISSSPSWLRRCKDPIGAENNQHLHQWFHLWALQPTWDLWLGWGAFGGLMQRDEVVLKMLNGVSDQRGHHPPPFVTGVTKAGYPRHPLYLPSGVQRSAWAVRFTDEPHSAPVSDFPSPVWRAERSGAFPVTESIPRLVSRSGQRQC